MTEVNELVNEDKEIQELANDISTEITGRAVPDQSKLTMEGFIEMRMRQKVIELIEVDAPMRIKWKEFGKFEKQFLGELRNVPRKMIRRFSLKNFSNYYREVEQLQKAIAEELGNSYEEVPVETSSNGN